MKVGVVVLHYLGKDLTKQCLDSVKNLKKGRAALEVLVINNNPQEDLEGLKKKFATFSFLETKKNLGYAGGNNFGLKKALEQGVDWVLLVNNDTILDSSLLVNLLKAAKKDSKIGVLGPKIYFAPGCEYHRDRYSKKDKGKVFWYAGGLIDWANLIASHRGADEVDRGQYDQQEETDFVSGCTMLVKKEVFEKIGLLDGKYFLYLEDNDFCQRARRVGFKVVYVPQAKLWHANAGSSQVGGPLHDYFLARNRMLYGLRFAPWRTKLNLIQESIRLLFKGRPWQKKGIRDFYLGRFGRGSWYE